LYRCGWHKSSNGAIMVSGLRGTGFMKDIQMNAVVNGNLLFNCSAASLGIIAVRASDRAIVSENIIVGAGGANESIYGIYLGNPSADTRSYMIICKNNLVDAQNFDNLVRGIQLSSVDEGLVEGNIVKLVHGKANIGIYAVTNGSVDYVNN